MKTVFLFSRVLLFQPIDFKLFKHQFANLFSGKCNHNCQAKRNPSKPVRFTTLANTTELLSLPLTARYSPQNAVLNPVRKIHIYKKKSKDLSPSSRTSAQTLAPKSTPTHRRLRCLQGLQTTISLSQSTRLR